MLRIGTWVALCFGILFTVPFAAVLVTIPRIAHGGGSTPMSSPVIATALSIVLVAVLAFAIAFGLWREKSWARPLMVAFWIAHGVQDFLVFRADSSVRPLAGPLIFLSSVPFFFIAIWYLYGKENVVAYYASLSRPRQPAL
jgi:hypothetical protein